MTLTKSGTAAAPIRLVSDGGAVRDVHITGDHVIVEGFTVTGGDGMLLAGSGITARNNTVHDTQQSGITCDPCTDSTIESNTITHVTTVGIWIKGQRITVHANTISGTVPSGESDADGMRFFGNGHRITGNTIRDISDNGYSNPPHPDCFQTYDQNSPATYDVVISGNTCRNVGAQCLIATGDQNHNGDAPTGGPSITFVDNICATNGAQAINLRRWANVDIRQNKISGPHLTRGIIIIDDSNGARVVGNATAGGQPTVDIDPSSRPGSQVEGNDPE
ncbi:MAG TPA: right-handed parallel beta-helix repeat-containing protein [Pseudonocardiaceae bacterium]